MRSLGKRGCRKTGNESYTKVRWRKSGKEKEVVTSVCGWRAGLRNTKGFCLHGDGITDCGERFFRKWGGGSPRTQVEEVDATLSEAEHRVGTQGTSGALKSQGQLSCLYFGKDWKKKILENVYWEIPEKKQIKGDIKKYNQTIIYSKTHPKCIEPTWLGEEGR